MIPEAAEVGGPLLYVKTDSSESLRTDSPPLELAPSKAI